jgi:quinolinate synthase
MLLWEGSCIVHESFSEKEHISLKTRHREAKIIAHPECPENLLGYADFIGSTAALIKFTEAHSGAEFIVLTEPGIIHQMRKNSPGSVFHEVPGISDGACASCNNCPYMRLNNIEKLYMCMINGSPEIQIEESLRIKAKAPLDMMLAMSK